MGSHAREIAFAIVKHCQKRFDRRGLVARTQTSVRMATGIAISLPHWNELKRQYVIEIAGWRDGDVEWVIHVYVLPTLDIFFEDTEGVPTNVVDCVFAAAEEAI
jgi:hypothetical protein